MKTNKDEYKWVPLERVGKFFLDTPCANYDIEKVITPLDDPVTGSGIYETDIQGIYLFEENGIIGSIECDKQFFFKNFNFIGMNIKQAISILGSEPSTIDKLILYADSPNDDKLNIIYYFDNFGLELWCVDDKVDSAIAEGKCEDE